MSHTNGESTPPEFEHVIGRLRGQRPKASAEELGRIKQEVTSLSSSARSRTRRAGGNGLLVGPRRVANLAVVVVLLGGGTAVIAASGTGPFHNGSNDFRAASSQYCPPTSQQPGKPKKPTPAMCGKPKTKQ